MRALRARRGPIASTPAQRRAHRQGGGKTGNILPFGLPLAGSTKAPGDPAAIGTTIAWNPANTSAGDRHMANDSLFGVHGAALEVRAQRMGVLASNIANASTPGFKAKDIDFKSALAQVEQTGDEGDAPTDLSASTLYRVPLQPSLDGNTVELNTEQTAFAENAVAYQTTLSFLNGRIAEVTRALKGE